MNCRYSHEQGESKEWVGFASEALSIQKKFKKIKVKDKYKSAYGEFRPLGYLTWQVSFCFIRIRWLS